MKCEYCGVEHGKNGRFCSRSCANKHRIASLKERECAICGGVFQPKSSSAKYCSPNHMKECAECGDEFSLRSSDYSRRNLCNKCSRKQSVKKQKKTMIQRYGVDNPMKSEEIREKARETSMEKYGREHYTQTEEYRERVRESNLEKYGVEHTFQREDVMKKISESREKLDDELINEKRRATVHAKYGVEYVSQSEESKKKVRETNLERYGVEVSLLNPVVAAKRQKTWDEKYGEGRHPFSSPSIREKSRETFQTRYNVNAPLQNTELHRKFRETMLQRHGAEYPLQVPEFLEKQIQTTNERIKGGLITPTRVSQLNRDFAAKIEELYGVEVVLEESLGSSGSSFDLYIPERRLFIDLNPTVSHNALLPFGCILKGCETSECGHEVIPRTYHYKRARLAMENNTSLIQIYDWDLPNLETLLNGKLKRGFKKISAKKLRVKKIPQREANDFLYDNHFQGRAAQQEYCYGLFSDGELLSVSTFGDSRFNKNYQYEFIRYAVKDEWIIHGGSQRLFNQFIRDVEPDSVMSYMNFDQTTREHTFLNSMGFKETSPSGPSLNFYNPKTKKRVGMGSLLSQGADRLLGTSYGSVEKSGLNNEEIMIKEGFFPIYTSGNRIFSWTN